MSDTNKSQQKEILSLLKKGGKIIMDFALNTTTFRVINGARVKTYPLRLLKKMKEEKLISLHSVESFCSVYKLPSKKEKETLSLQK